MRIELLWPTRADRRLRAEIHRVLHDVAELGGVIGYLSPPSQAETDAWLDEILAAAGSGDAALAHPDARGMRLGRTIVAALGRGPGVVLRGSAPGGPGSSPRRGTRNNS